MSQERQLHQQTCTDEEGQGCEGTAATLPGDQKPGYLWLLGLKAVQLVEGAALTSRIAHPGCLPHCLPSISSVASAATGKECDSLIDVKAVSKKKEEKEEKKSFEAGSESCSTLPHGC